MGKMYTISEDNYQEIIRRLARMCHKYKFLSKLETVETPVREKEEKYIGKERSIYKSWGYRNHIRKTGNGTYVREKEFYQENMLVVPKEHIFKIDFDRDPNSINGMMYQETESLIHLSIGNNQAIALRKGDKIRFEKYGFITYYDSGFGDGRVSHVFINTFVKDITNGRIEDYAKEVQEMMERRHRLNSMEDDES